MLKSYTTELFRPACNPGFKSLHCIAHLNQDVSRVIPYLNAVLGGFEYIEDPPAVTFLSMGRLISVYSRKIAINALKDATEADKILNWLVQEINAAWENRATIQPRREGAPKPKLIEILKLLPRTNCKECGEPTCMVFAARMAEGAKDPGDCPPMDAGKIQPLQEYMSQFKFDD